MNVTHAPDEDPRPIKDIIERIGKMAMEFVDDMVVMYTY